MIIINDDLKKNVTIYAYKGSFISEMNYFINNRSKNFSLQLPRKEGYHVLNIVLNLLLVYIQANIIALQLTEIFSVKIKTIETYHALELSSKFLKSIK